MPRTIKRYGSRKLYDTGASEYVSLDRVAALIREGEDVQIVDNKSGDDVTGVVLAQIIAEEGRNGSGLSSGFLHDLVRMGERVIRKGEETVGDVVAGAKKNVGEMVGDARRRVREVAPLADVRGEMVRLRERLDALESSLDERDSDETPEPPANAG
ncbi:MAG: polyhydroxyalkanoate synthesis regulator DNA-binding domain-containing protein [Bacteroidota bacterium]